MKLGPRYDFIKVEHNVPDGEMRFNNRQENLK